jgi:hypothetical protein
MTIDIKEYRREHQRVCSIRKEKQQEVLKLQAEIKQLSVQIGILNKTMEQPEQALKPLEVRVVPKPQPLRKATREPRITDHALFRYVERQCGFDLEELRAKLLTPALRAAALNGVHKFKTIDGTFVIENGHIVTYYP